MILLEILNLYSVFINIFELYLNHMVMVVGIISTEHI